MFTGMLNFKHLFDVVTGSVCLTFLLLKILMALIIDFILEQL
jgi:hypothetical protein